MMAKGLGYAEIAAALGTTQEAVDPAGVFVLVMYLSSFSSDSGATGTRQRCGTRGTSRQGTRWNKYRT